MKKSPIDLYHTAIHEVGHAVAALELDVLFDEVSIVPGEGRAGAVGVEGDDCFFVPPGTDPHSTENERAFREWAQRQAIIDYAGHAAVVALLGFGDMSYRSGVLHGASDDFDKASARLGRNRGRMTLAKARASEIVSHHGTDIGKR